MSRPGFHDKYCSATGPIFAIGETGLGYAGQDSDKINWLQGIASAKDSMQYLHGVGKLSLRILLKDG
jgi:hypothetical protein